MAHLADEFCARNAGARDPFQPVTVIVQSVGLGQWLKLRFATQHGIAANISCQLPAAFLWRLYQMLLPNTVPFRESPFDRAQMPWRIMRILKEQSGLSDAISNYLDNPGDPDLRAYQLGHEISDLFDQYLMYRPDWMMDWQSADPNQIAEKATSMHQAWQQRLWQLMLEDMAGGLSVADGPSIR